MSDALRSIMMSTHALIKTSFDCQRPYAKKMTLSKNKYVLLKKPSLKRKKTEPL